MFDFIYKLTLIGTFFVLIWYTVETYKIRKINTSEKDLQLLPAIMIYIRQHSGSERPFIKNIGFGSAINVRVLSSSFNVDGKQFNFTFHLVDGNNTLLSQEERQIGVNLTIDGERHRNPLPNFLAYHNPSNLQDVRFRKKNLIVQLKDITGQSYETIIVFSDRGISVAKAVKRIDSDV